MDNNTLLTKYLNNIDKQVLTSNDNIRNIVLDVTAPGYESLVGDALNGLSNLIYKGIFGLRDMILNTSILVDGVKAYSTTTPNIKTLMAMEHKVKVVIKEDKLNISKIYNTKAPVTLGLDVNLDTLYSGITTMSLRTGHLLDNLDELYEFLGNIMSSNVEDIKTSLPRDNKLKVISDDNKALLKMLNTFTSTKVMTDRKPVKELIPKIVTLPKLMTNSLKLGKQFQIETLTDIHNRTLELSEMTTSVLKTLNVKNNVDKDTLYKLSNYLKVIAENITMVSFTYYSYYQLLDMLVGVSRVVVSSESIESKMKENQSSFTNSIMSLFK